MLTLYLEQSWQGAERRQLEPVVGLRIVGRSVRILPREIEILRLIGNQWRDDEDTFDAFVIESSTLVYVERGRNCKRRFYGPFDYIRMEYGTIYASRDRRRTLGCFSPFGEKWHTYPDHADWPAVILFPSGIKRLLWCRKMSGKKREHKHLLI